MMDEVASGKQGRLLCIMYSDGDRVPETRVLGFGSGVENWVKGKLNKVFLYFLPNFWHMYLMIFKVECD